ncbi:DUF2231 domain-containing protein [Halocola ammonii]
MDQLPSMWRTELWHPLFVHFAIGILIISSAVGLAWLVFQKKSFASNLRFTLSLLLWTGIVFFWITFFTGQEAYNEVVRTICDPFVLKDHLWWAQLSAWVFSAATVLDVAARILKNKAGKILPVIVVLLLLGGAATISYSGHLGASVVYQQGGGVHQPSEDCSEFE